MSSEIFSNLGRRLGDLSLLPEEVRSQLSKNAPDQYDLEIMRIIDSQYDGYASTDEILVALFTVYNRRVVKSELAIKLANMKKRKFIYPISGKTDAFSTRQFHRIIRFFKFTKSKKTNFYY